MAVRPRTIYVLSGVFSLVLVGLLVIMGAYWHLSVIIGVIIWHGLLFIFWAGYLIEAKLRKQAFPPEHYVFGELTIVGVMAAVISRFLAVRTAPILGKNVAEMFAIVALVVVLLAGTLLVLNAFRFADEPIGKLLRRLWRGDFRKPY